jgi:hypothetical protein
MTTHKHLKARVRARMSRTDERYAVARARVTASDRNGSGLPVARGIRHFGGANPATTALRALVTHAGVLAPDGDPLSEGLLLVIGGGIGAGVFSFRYQADDVSTLFLAGRHRWEDDAEFLREAARRLGLTSSFSETGGRIAAARNLHEALSAGPAIAWVDLAELGTRGFPSEWSGGAYHVVVVYEIDDRTGVVTLGDLAGLPVQLPLDTLVRARDRIVKFRNRVLTLTTGDRSDPVGAAISGVRDGIRALDDPRRRNFGLRAFRDLADRIHGSRGKDAWSRVFPRGRHLFVALQAVHRHVEGYGSGGGLIRPLFAAGLAEAAAISGNDGLAEAGDRYAALGRAWTELAHAALPDDVPLLKESRRIQVTGERDYRIHGAAAVPALEAGWARLREIEREVADDFPLSENDTDDLLAGLRGRLLAISSHELEALDVLRSAV